MRILRATRQQVTNPSYRTETTRFAQTKNSARDATTTPQPRHNHNHAAACKIAASTPQTRNPSAESQCGEQSPQCHLNARTRHHQRHPLLQFQRGTSGGKSVTERHACQHRPGFGRIATVPQTFQRFFHHCRHTFRRHQNALKRDKTRLLTTTQTSCSLPPATCHKVPVLHIYPISRILF